MCAVPNMAVFCSSLTSCFPGVLLRYFLNVFEIVPVAPAITGITFVYTFHMRYLLLLLLLLLIHSQLLVIRWQSSGKSRSHQEIKAIYPRTLRMMCAVLISVIFCSNNISTVLFSNALH